MQINIKAKNIDLTEELKKYINEKVEMLEKYIGNAHVLNCDVEVEKIAGGQNSGEIYRAEINLEMQGELLRIEKTEKDINKAIDKAKDHMIRSIKKYKEKKISKKRKEENKIIKN